MPPSKKRGEGERFIVGKALRDAGPLFGSGIQMAAAIVLMFFLGRWLDDQWESAPWMMLTCTLVGVAAGLVQFFRTVSEVTKGESKEKKR